MGRVASLRRQTIPRVGGPEQGAQKGSVPLEVLELHRHDGSDAWSMP